LDMLVCMNLTAVMAENICVYSIWYWYETAQSYGQTECLWG
jgi:hypothetical protein